MEFSDEEKEQLAKLLAAVAPLPPQSAPKSYAHPEYIPAGIDRSLRFIIWLVGGLIVITAIATTAWMKHDTRLTNLEAQSSEFNRIKTARDGEIRALMTFDESMKLWMAQVTSTIEGNRKERMTDIATLHENIADLRKWQEKYESSLIEMTGMLERGESNQDAFYRKHNGLRAPSDTRTGPSLKP